MKAILLSLSLLGVSVATQAAIPKKTTVSRSALLRVLDLPDGNRGIVIRQKNITLTQLDRFVQNPRGSLQMRWRAITSFPAVKDKRSKTLRFIQPYLKSKKWWQRAAALVSLERLDPALGVEAAHKLMRDPALIVRSSAVEIITKKGSSADKNRLWPYLNDKINFYKGQGLWVRQQIMEALAADRVQPSDRFTSFVNDKDSVVRKIAQKRTKN